MSRLGRGLPNNALLQFVPAIIPVVYDSTGIGKSGSANSWSWNHAITGNAVIVWINATLASATAPTMAAKIGTTPMTQLEAYTNYGSGAGGLFFSMYLFGLLNGPSGTQTLSVNSTATAYTAANSVSYVNVANFGTPTISSGSGATPSISAPSGPMQLVAQAFSGSNANNVFSSYSQTSRFNINNASGSNMSLIAGDAPGSTSLSFSATSSPADPWGAVAIPLVPV